jgi:acyl-ACP thioesterase
MEVDGNNGNLMRTKGFWWVIDKNKRNLMGTL